MKSFNPVFKKILLAQRLRVGLSMFDSLSRAHPAAVAGASFAICCFLMLDAVLVANAEPLSENRFTFVLSIPFIFSVIGYAIMNLTSPAQVGDELSSGSKRAKGIFFCGWFILFAASVGALAVCGKSYVGEGTRRRSSPGVCLVLASSLLPLSSVSLWWGKGTRVSSDELEWGG